ncbi:MAG: hypothetical protein ACI3ZP_09175 [Candidatus Cryptobacteroides sp.]
MQKIIDITTILGPDIKSRVAARDFKLFVENTGAQEIIADFANVKFATRSFLDEFYNCLLKENASERSIKVINMPEDLAQVLCAVKNTQHKIKSGVSTGSVTRCTTRDELRRFLSSLTL